MKDIKFRCWNKDENKMIYNAQGAYDYGCRGIDLPVNNFQDVIDEDRFELMQFTGLHDKNGVEIYEGDILLNTTYGDLWVVEFYDGSWIIENKNKNIKDVENLYDIEGLLVYSNIYDNPDLVKGSE